MNNLPNQQLITQATDIMGFLDALLILQDVRRDLWTSCVQQTSKQEKKNGNGVKQKESSLWCRDPMFLLPKDTRNKRAPPEHQGETVTIPSSPKEVRSKVIDKEPGQRNQRSEQQGIRMTEKSPLLASSRRGGIDLTSQYQQHKIFDIATVYNFFLRELKCFYDGSCSSLPLKKSFLTLELLDC